MQVVTILASGSAVNWASSYNLTYPVLEDHSGALLKPYPSIGFPTHVVIDRAMVVQWVSPPDLDYWYDEGVILAVIRQYL